MPKHQETRLLPFTAQQMFDLVIDVECYPEFLPWCQSCQIVSQEGDFLIADLGIGYKGMSQTFRSQVNFISPSEIKVDYLEGRLKYLKNIWHFEDLQPNQCKIDFFIDFSFGRGLLQFAIEAIFEKALSQMIHSFEQRANKIYGLKRY